MSVTGTVFIRTDSSAIIGSGHFYRCLVLAHELRKRRVSVCFIAKSLEGNFNSLLKSQQFEVVELDANLNQEQDSQLCVDLISKVKNPFLIIDNYYLDVPFEKNISSHCPTLVIDDLLPREHQSTLHLDQNFFTNYDLHPANTLNPISKKLLGPQYSLIRESFLNLKCATMPDSTVGMVQVLIFFGGSDPTGETLRFIQETKLLSFSKFKILIVASIGNRHIEEIRKQSLPPEFTLMIQPSNFPEVMSKSNVYFGSGGSITWERMFLGLPGYVVSVADNQIEMSQQLSDAGLQTYLGKCVDLNYNQIFKSIVDNLDTSKLAQQASAGKKLVDGLGAIRVVDAIMESIR